MKIGIDLEDNSRFIRLIKKEAFMNRVFTQYEREYIQKKGNKGHLAACGIFCVKEAFSKALGCGIFSLAMQDVCVVHSETGRPFLSLSGRHEGLQTEISISHSGSSSTAVCIITE